MNEVFITLLLTIAAGVVFGRLRGMPSPSDTRRVIGAMVFNVFLPALSFYVLSTARLNTDLIFVPLIAIAVALVCFVMAWLVYARGFQGKLSVPATGSMILAATFCNATYLGLPMVEAIVGAEARHIPLLFDMLGMSIVLFSLGTIICVEYGSKGTRHTLKQGLLEVAKMPPLIAALLGLVVNLLQVSIPEFATLTLKTLGQLVAPLMLFSIGLALRPPKLSSAGVIAPAALIKLIVAPAIGVALVNWLLTDNLVANATVLETAMPTMVLTIVFAERYGLDEELLAQAVVITTLLSMVTIHGVV